MTSALPSQAATIPPAPPFQIANRPPLPSARENQEQPQSTLFSHALNPASQVISRQESQSTFKKISVLFAPILSLSGGFGLLASAALKRKPNLLKGILGKTIREEQVNRLANISNKIVSIGFFFGAWNDTLSGVTNKQPTMLFSGILQFIPATLLALNSRLKIPEAFIWNFWTLLAGIWTLGFANDMVNKKFSNGTEKPRQYEMNKLISAFKSNSHFTLLERLKIIGDESRNMLSFVIQDHILAAKSLRQNVSRLHTDKRQDLDWKQVLEPSVPLSRLSIVLTYLGALPSLLWAFKKKPEPKLLEGLTVFLRGSALTLANLSFFDMALHRKDLKGKMPILGFPLATIGIAKPHGNGLRGASQLGEGLNSLFVSDIAVKGIPENEKKQASQPRQLSQPFEIPYYEHHRTQHRHFGNKIQNGGVQA